MPLRMTSTPSTKPAVAQDGPVARLGLALAQWSEKWFPDPLVFAFIGIVFVFVSGVVMGERPAKLALEGGKGFWSLVPFTMQMVMIIIGGYVVATTPIVQRAISGLAGSPSRRAPPSR